MGWLEAALPCAQEWSATDVIELATALEPMALECGLLDAEDRWNERWDELERNLSHRPEEMRRLRSASPARRASARRLLLLHRAYRQFMLLAPAELARVRALAAALRVRGSLKHYLHLYPDGASYLKAALDMPLAEAKHWLRHQEPSTLD